MIRTKWLLAILVYCALIFWASSQPQPVDLKGLPGLDKIAHACLYGGLALLVSFGLRRSSDGLRPAMQFHMPIVFVAFYGLSDELHQYFVPTRSFDPLDIAADVFGAVVVQCLLFRYLWQLPLPIPRRA